MSQSLACRDHLLHERNTREAAALHAQLRRLLARQHIASAQRLATEAPLSTTPSAAVASRLARGHGCPCRPGSHLASPADISLISSSLDIGAAPL